jgi:hypothetical protein
VDLAVYGRVLWRFRFVVALGTICALLVAILAMAHVGFSSGRPTFRYRSHELWTSQSTLLVTQRGFPEGRLTLPQNSDPAAPPLPGQQTFADPSRLVFLASLYAQFAKADAIDAIVRPRAGEKVLAAPVNDTSSGSSVGSPLPLVSVAGLATSSERALQITRLATAAFRNYIDRRQGDAGIPLGDRVVLRFVSRPSAPVVFQARRKTPAVLAFVVVLLATFGLVFALENLRKSRKVATVESIRAEDEPRSERTQVRENAAATGDRAQASAAEQRQQPVARF